MKVIQPANWNVLIVGHRRPWKRQIRLTARQWRFGIGIVVGLVPLIIAVGVYGLCGRIFPHYSPVAGQNAAEVSALRGKVALLTQNTEVGLDAMAIQLGALNADAMRLTALRNRLVRSAGIHEALFRSEPKFEAQAAVANSAPHLIAALHALSLQLNQQNPSKGSPGSPL
ncbi:MAG TPA: hypothetical protein VMV40_09635 [Acidiferrobacter sp.]|nr:hypothetical protein [Acidiferrobacter sp.]